MMKIRGYEFKNYTPHEVHLILANEIFTIASAGNVRVGEERQETEIEFVKKKQFTTPIGLPEPETNTYYIVSNLVLSACPERTDLVAPDLLCRDEKGKIIGCMGFSN